MALEHLIALISHNNITNEIWAFEWLRENFNLVTMNTSEQKCKLCGDLFNSLRGLNIHMNVHRDRLDASATAPTTGNEDIEIWSSVGLGWLAGP